MLDLTPTQIRILHFAEANYVYAEARPEGDVVLFTELCLDGELLPFHEIEVVASVTEARAVMGY